RADTPVVEKRTVLAAKIDQIIFAGFGALDHGVIARNRLILQFDRALRAAAEFPDVPFLQLHFTLSVGVFQDQVWTTQSGFQTSSSVLPDFNPRRQRRTGTTGGSPHIFAAATSGVPRVVVRQRACRFAWQCLIYCFPSTCQS